LIGENQPQQFYFFSPLFEHFVAQQAPQADSQLYIDRQAGVVWVNGRQTKPLTDKEFKLLAFLAEHPNEICDVGEIIGALYPGAEGYNINDNAISALVKRVREKIEPATKHPQFLLNVKGRGYKLVPLPA
jgi:DNA-binding response OmpR family regulator